MPKLGLIVVDPGHFHAALAQQEMYPNVSERVQVYAPVGLDLADYLTRIARFNTRAAAPTAWQLDIRAGGDFLDRMARDKAGDAAIFAGRNHQKIGMAARAVEAGLHVLADKPMIIRRSQLPELAAVLDAAMAKGLVVQDMMGGRQEVTRALTRLLHADREIFGEQLPGTAAEPGVAMTSLHHLMKVVSGMPNPRPPWYFDIAQQGDALADIGTHLVDRVHGTLFPETALDYRHDVTIGAVRRWPVMLDLGQFRQVTGMTDWPAYLAAAVAGDTLAYQCNAHLDYAVRGVHVGLDMVWEWLEPVGGGDTHTETWRGSRARIELRHGPDEGWRPQLYLVPLADVAAALERRVAALAETYPGLGLERRAREWRVVIPDALRIGHDAHFRELTKGFLARIEQRQGLTAEERANLLAKYHVTTAAEAAQGGTVR
ncbi:MAG TPA: putative oxidoreductase C-terminal domain-containing protein [Stellaceae bacterium]|nr:putative oxidoreductase C-terminal domain-containing protein [Stellaceae bacterium]